MFMMLVTRTLLSAVVLGAIGLFIGSYGLDYMVPGGIGGRSLIGILCTGPIAAAIGLLVGAISAYRVWTTRGWVTVLVVGAVIVALATASLTWFAYELSRDVIFG